MNKMRKMMMPKIETKPGGKATSNEISFEWSTLYKKAR
jgi:hypothetical protein